MRGWASDVSVESERVCEFRMRVNNKVSSTEREFPKPIMVELAELLNWSEHVGVFLLK